MKRLVDLQMLGGPVVLILVAALLGTTVSLSTQSYFTDALVKVAIVVGLYVFIGNSGVVSFGNISFVAIGAWTAGVLSVPAAEKPAIMPNLAHFLRDRTTGNVSSLVLAGVVGGVCALAAALPLMRLSGLAAGIATFAVLEITHNVLRYEEKLGPWPQHVLVRSRDDRPAPGCARRRVRRGGRVRLQPKPLRAPAAGDA